MISRFRLSNCRKSVFPQWTIFLRANFSSKPQDNKNVHLKDKIKDFSTEFYRIVKEDLLSFKSHKKAGKTYTKIDKKAVNDKPVKDETVTLNTEVQSIMVTPEKLTFWQRLMGKTKETKIYSKYQGYSKQFAKYAKQNPNFQKFLSIRDSISDKKDELAELYETSQNPLVWKLRDASDRLFGESDTSFALRKLKLIEPDFSPYDFIMELKIHILPAIIQAILTCDMEFIEQTCIDDAHKAIYGYIKAREHSEADVSCQLIDVMETEYINASLHSKQPVLNFSCISKHLETVTKKKIKKGEKNLPTYYSKDLFFRVSLTLDKECPVFGWKFVDIQMQQVFALESK